MKMYVIRHGQSEANKNGMHAGWGPVPLTELGRSQAVEAGRKLTGLAAQQYAGDTPFAFDQVYVSDILRTRQTAQLALPGYAYRLDERIREFSSGSLVGRRVEECKATLGEPYLRALRERDYTAYGGENGEMVKRRVDSFLKDMELQEAAGMKSVAVVSHEGAILYMLYYVLQCRFPESSVGIGNCSITTLECIGGKWRLCL